jgi:hypothetical protein
MKRLVLLSVGALMLAATVFAPVAMAQEAVLDIQSVTLGTGGTANVSGTIQCPAGNLWQASVEIRQTTGNRPFNNGSGRFPDTGTVECSGGEDAFTINTIGERPFKKGNVLVTSGATACEPDFSSCSFASTPIEEFRIR